MRRTKTIAESKIKTDKLDAKTIAQCLRTGFIATAYIPPKTIMEQRNILRHRMSLRKEITRYKNKKGRNKAIVAASRKLLTCIWYMLMKGETFKYSNDD